MKDTKDIMDANGTELFLTDIELDESELSDELKDFITFEELEEESIAKLNDTAKMILAEYEKEIAEWQEEQDRETKEWIKTHKKPDLQ